MPRLPYASRQDLVDELAEIRRERDHLGTVGDRADEQRANLDWWEQDLLEQLQEMSAAADEPGETPTEKLPCGCHAAVDKDGYRRVAAEGFLCEAGHKQGDLVEVREGLARLPGPRGGVSPSGKEQP